MNQRQRAVIAGTLKIGGLLLLGLWLGGAFIAWPFHGVRDPLAFLLLSIWWGVIGCYAVALTAGWPTLGFVALVVTWALHAGWSRGGAKLGLPCTQRRLTCDQTCYNICPNQDASAYSAA